MKTSIMILFLFILSPLAVLSDANGQKKSATSSPSPEPFSKVENFFFLYEYFGKDYAKTYKYWNEAAAGMKMIVFISLNDKDRPQHLDVLDLSDTFKIVLTTVISGGTKNHPTPLGTTKIYSKLKSLHSDKYNCDMTYWNNIHPQGKIGIHGLNGLTYEDKLGKPASHGCIRLNKKVEKIFWHLVPVGTKVVVY